MPSLKATLQLFLPMLNANPKLGSFVQSLIGDSKEVTYSFCEEHEKGTCRLSKAVHGHWTMAWLLHGALCTASWVVYYLRLKMVLR